LHIIRKASRTDALQLSQLAEQTFRATFGAMNTAENMDMHCQVSFGEAIQTVEISDPNMVTLLAENEAKLVGFAQLCWGNAPSCVFGKAPGEVQRLYVVSEWHGKGIAQDLMNAGIEEMRRHGSDVVWLGVWEHNPRAIAFYKKIGFIEVGDHVFPLGSDLQRDIVLARLL
jgi:diamine N-acetyltransferase